MRRIVGIYVIYKKARHGIYFVAGIILLQVFSFTLQYPNAPSWHDPRAPSYDNALNTCL